MSTRNIRLFLAHAVFGVVLAAGVLKSLDLGTFKSALSTWSLIPSPLTDILAILVPATEIVLAGLWFCGIARWAVGIATLLLLLLASSFYIAHLALVGKPECACFGPIRLWEDQRVDAVFVLARNAGLFAMLLVGLPCATRRSSGQSTARLVARVSSGRSGFSLVELLIVIGLIGVLISMIFPSISRFRDGARRAVSLSNIKQHGTILAAYSVDYKGYHPYFTDPNASFTILRTRIIPRTTRVGYFIASSSWNVALADAYYEGQHSSKAFAAPYPERSIPSYIYACSMIARPEYWNPRTRFENRSQWRATRTDEVLFPSQKTLLSAIYPLLTDVEQDGGVIMKDSRFRTEMGFCDGSASGYSSENVLDGYPNGDGTIGPDFIRVVVPISIHFVDWPWGSHTIDGVRGRDVQSR
jgi:prepilin-type N-terminal cleavage/methylation domain-containing protein